jgi:anthranilate synthase
MNEHTKDTMTDLGTGQRYLRYTCASGVGITRTTQTQEYPTAVATLASKLDSAPGVLLASSYEYPGRYRRWDIGFVNPPLMFEGRGRSLQVSALNQRGRVLLPEIELALRGCDAVASVQANAEGFEVQIKESSGHFTEEQRSRQPTVFSALRALTSHFKSSEDSFLGLFGAFGYDLTFQFEDIDRLQRRSESDRDLVLYLPDEILVADHRVRTATLYRYEFLCRGEAKSGVFDETTGGFVRSGPQLEYVPGAAVATSDHAVGEFAATVRHAQEHFSRGELFEAVPGQVFSEPCRDKPSEVFARLQTSNPAPYGALINLGKREYLVAASPEMFVRVRGRRVETCPISGTIARGRNAIEDAAQIKTLLNSTKDEAELSMCTDVDRNDKARVCVPGSIEVIGRRQIELYSRLIHTVDHVCGTLRDGMDALDAFLAHTWAVTVTGAPKLAAMQFIERVEKSPRHWYGGAMGQLGFDGNINTGLTLRTLRVKDGVGEVRAGATLLSDSVPEDEEAETHLKASALLGALRAEKPLFAEEVTVEPATQKRTRPRALMVDHRDSFVHNLAHYFREAGVDLITLRPEAARAELRQHKPDLLILSPGPGRPEDFQMNETLSCAQEFGVPVFGVCLGLQGMVEYFGGSLRQLPVPMHGKGSLVDHEDSAVFEGVPSPFRAGRYHSLVADRVPASLRVIASSDDGEVMAVEHETLPFCAVQFHPESILSLEGEAGRKLIANVVGVLVHRE